MKLYLIACEHAGENFDALCIAETPDQATRIWRAWDYPRGYELRAPDRVFEIEAATVEGPARRLDWHAPGLVEVTP